MEGWIALRRGIHEHPIFHQNPERMFVWTWMLMTAAWKDTRQNVGGEIVTVPRGSLCVSQGMITKATGVPRQPIRTLLHMLEAEGAIETRPATNATKGRTMITICNYDRYQTVPQATNQTATKQQPTKEQGNNTSKEDAAFAAPADLKKIAFDGGIKLLCAGGQTERAARGLVAKWIRDNGEAATIEALGWVQRQGSIDPVSATEAALRRHGNRPANVKSGEASFGHFGKGEVVR